MHNDSGAGKSATAVGGRRRWLWIVRMGAVLAMVAAAIGVAAGAPSPASAGPRVASADECTREHIHHRHHHHHHEVDDGHDHGATGALDPCHHHHHVHHSYEGYGLPTGWTDKQKTYARRLIRTTEESLETDFTKLWKLRRMGFRWIGDGVKNGKYRHWVNLGWFNDGHVLDPERPESLVFRKTTDGLVLEAAMYMLPSGVTMSTISDEYDWLPGWHVHDNLCFDGSGTLVGLAVDGKCEVGFLYITPPMLHVWIVDTECGRFAGVDEGGLQCDHHHHH